MAEWCTKQSFCPSSRGMKPKPFASLNHFTVPVVRIAAPKSNCHGEAFAPPDVTREHPLTTGPPATQAVREKGGLRDRRPLVRRNLVTLVRVSLDPI